jgi:hypothetical protein
MKLITFRVNLAFLDSLNVSAERVRGAIIENILDGMEAEVQFSSDVTERVVNYPDIDFDSDEGIAAWQQRALSELEAVKFPCVGAVADATELLECLLSREDVQIDTPTAEVIHQVIDIFSPVAQSEVTL